MHRSVRLSSVLPLLAVLLFPLALFAASYTWNLDGAGVWDDTPANPGNWNVPNVVPISGDNVTINRANGATVDFASTHFDTAPEFLASLTLGGSGAANTLQVGSGDTLRYNGALTVNSGGLFDFSGGLVEAVGTAGTNGLTVNNGGQVKITGGEFLLQKNGHINLAVTAGHTASLEVSGSGQLLAPNTGSGAGLDFNAQAGNSTLTLADSGVIRVFRNLLVGTTGGSHDWTISGGNLLRGPGTRDQWTFGNNLGNGTVSILQTGGTVNSNGADLNIRRTANYQITGDPSTVSLVVGNIRVDGILDQSGGNVYCTWTLIVGNAAGQNGQYMVSAGILDSREIRIANTPDSSGTLTIGSGVTWLTHSLNGTGQDPRIGATSGSGTGTLEVKGVSGVGGSYGLGYTTINQTGVLRGYGSLNGVVYLLVNGRVIADGYGVDRTLSLAAMPIPTNTVDNPVGGNRGWYAVDGGKLTLPNITVPTGASARNWGEDATDSSIDLVNSLRLEFTGVETAGPLSISLLASDRGDVPAAPFAAYGGTLIGVWEIAPASGSSFAFGAGSVDLTFRYDDALAPANQDLYVFHYTGGQWVPITSGIDLDTRTIWADGVTSFSLFAVGYIPEPASATLLALLALGLARRPGAAVRRCRWPAD